MLVVLRLTFLLVTFVSAAFALPAIHSLHGSPIRRALNTSTLASQYYHNNTYNSSPSQGNAASFWIGNIDHTGLAPFIAEKDYYKVFRNVKDYGAVGDGVRDDTAAIQKAIDDGNRCITGCGGGTTGKPALIYFPSGTYRVSSPIKIYLSTALVGDALNLPVLKAVSEFGENPVIQGFPQNNETHSTTNFYLQVRNFRIDVRDVGSRVVVSCINWAVAQGTVLRNIEFLMKDYSMHQGIEQDGGEGGGGSGVFMGDLSFRGGSVGILFSNQQFTFRNISFTNTQTAIYTWHTFALTFQDLHFKNCSIGINASRINEVGSILLMDSTAESVSQLILTDNSGTGSGSIVIENLKIKDTHQTVVASNGKLLLPRGTRVIKSWVQGNVYSNNSNQSSYRQGNLTVARKPVELLNADGSVFTRKRPQYETFPVEAFSSVKEYGAKGDGTTDDTAAINKALAANAGGRITYLPAGTYIVTDTIQIPPGSRIVGEVWSTISAKGATFKSEANPGVVVQVGKLGDVGVAEISDVVFTTAEVLPGAILVEINMAGTSQGDVGMWDTTFRIGGALGSTVETKCGSTAASCKAAFMLLHVKPTGSPYLENVWGWTADHDLDGTNGQTISTGRGFLIESTEAAWLVGSSVEHNTLYQYQLVNAKNVYLGLIQVETPYWQSEPQAPSPWTPSSKYSDPDFSACPVGDVKCYMAWGFRVIGGENIFLYGSGYWTFFNKYSAECSANDGNCQENIIDISGNPRNLVLYNTNVHSIENLVTVDGKVAARRSDNPGSWGGVVAAYLGFERRGL